MIRWMYRVVYANTINDDQLNALGKQGWELVSVANHLHYFKQPATKSAKHQLEGLNAVGKMLRPEEEE